MIKNQIQDNNIVEGNIDEKKEKTLKWRLMEIKRRRKQKWTHR